MATLNKIKVKSTWGNEVNSLNENFDVLHRDIRHTASLVRADKGHFKTLEDLKAQYPIAPVGSKAIVGTELPWTLFIADTEGNWVESGTISELQVSNEAANVTYDHTMSELEAINVQDAIDELNSNVVSVDTGLTEHINLVDLKHSQGKVFCEGILVYGETPLESGYYLQKDKDGDIACVTSFNKDTGEKIYSRPEVDKIYVVEGSFYVMDIFRIVPIGYREVVLSVQSPLEEDELSYHFDCDVFNEPSKEIQLSPLK